jgi:chromosome segregation ATPase
MKGIVCKMEIMDNEKLMEMKNNIAMLETLQKRMKKLTSRIYDAEKDITSLLCKFEKESLDVEKLKAENFSTMLLRVFGKYDDKLDYETEEMLLAKADYDKSVERVNELKQQRNELGSRIAELKKDKPLYESELRKREEYIRNNMTNETSVKYVELEKEQKLLLQQIIETDEAIRAANKAMHTAESGCQYLESAEKWATYDVWFKSGIIGHMSKYNNIDNAESEFNKLSSQLKDLQKELHDVKTMEISEISGIDSTTRAIDFWFDNIFTDLKVRGKIRSDIEQVNDLLGKLRLIISRLENNKKNINRKISDVENKKKDLILNLGTTS